MIDIASLPKRWPLLAAILLTLFSGRPAAQCPLPQQVWDSLLRIEAAPEAARPAAQKLKQVLALKATMDECRLPKDSVYARILHRIGLYQYHSTRELNQSIRNTLESIAINTSGEPGACPRFAVNSYGNLGYYYLELAFYDQALRYFDTSALLSVKFPGQQKFLLQARQNRSVILLIKGDLQASEEEATRGLQAAQDLHDTGFIIKFLDQRAYAYARQGSVQPATADFTLAFDLATQRSDNDGKAGSLRAKASLLESEGRFAEALSSYDEVIPYRILSRYSKGLAEDYLDAGNLLLYRMNKPPAAKPYFQKSVLAALQAGNGSLAAKGYNSLASTSFYLRDYPQALADYRQTLSSLNIPTGPDNVSNPASAWLIRSQNKEILLWVFGNKTECLLQLYRHTARREYLSACLRTALLTDSLITSMRHEQIGESSKLYWRSNTREFFSNALEACWLAEDPGLAFYFMEKSRAVLLNDKLNELGASAFLPRDEITKEQSLQIEIIQQQQALSALSPDSLGYSQQLARLLAAKDEQERFIRLLEQKAPAYYQYKFADDVPPLDSLRRVLSRNRQSFIHYFVRDTVMYVLAISPQGARFLRLRSQGMADSLNNWLHLCSNDQSLNSTYREFAALSHALYLRLIQPLHLSTTRVVVCPDNFLIPFEALCTDTAGKHFLLNDHIFDYAYSARSWLTPAHNSGADQNFLGIAPGSFATALHMPDLQGSDASIRRAAAFYPGGRYLTGKDADRQHFLQQASEYTIVNIYSHAQADSTDSEPLLYFADSTLHLSELQMMQRPTAQLIVLSACQTSMGKGASGEGIYSLARGFSAAGIPAIAATLWPADDRATYAITEQFHRNLAAGMRKDEALQKAKLNFMDSSGGNRLPYYWADMILIGNADAIRMKAKQNLGWWVIGAGAVLLLLLSVALSRYPFTRTKQISEDISPPG
jgi:CHAT domain-containing protein/tetratricopeptide (TPR) repeat protein